MTQPAFPAQPEAVQPPPAVPQTSTLAIVSLVAAFLFWPAGLVLAIVALSQIKRTYENGKSLAVAAIVVSSVALVLTVLAAGLFVMGGTVSNHFEKTCSRVEDPSNPGTTTASCS